MSIQSSLTLPLPFLPSSSLPSSSPPSSSLPSSPSLFLHLPLSSFISLPSSSLSPSSLTSSPPPSLPSPPPPPPLSPLSTVDRLKYQSITALPEFSTKSFDELRLAHISQQPEGGVAVGRGSSIAERGLIHRRMATLKKLLTCRQIRPFIIKLVRASGEASCRCTLFLTCVSLYPNSSTARMEMATPPSWRPSASVTTLLHCRYSSLWKNTTRKS